MPISRSTLFSSTSLTRVARRGRRVRSVVELDELDLFLADAAGIRRRPLCHTVVVRTPIDDPGPLCEVTNPTVISARAVSRYRAKR